MPGEAGGKRRLDELVVERGLAETRARAQAIIMGGGITVDGAIVTKPGVRVLTDAPINLVIQPLAYVSRGGLKLAHALDAFHLRVEGDVAIDVGASTGGFTDVLLQRGAGRVYAIDVGYGQLAWTLRNDPRVVVMERTNIRNLSGLPELANLAVIDVSFISLRQVLPHVKPLLIPAADAVVLVKPQFEAGKGKVGKNGVVREPQIWREVLSHVLIDAENGGWVLAGLTASPVRGPAGNVEFLAWLTLRHHAPSLDRASAIEGVIAEVTAASERHLEAHSPPTRSGLSG